MNAAHLRQIRLFLLLLLLAMPALGGLLSFIQVFKDGLGVDGLNGVIDVAVAPGGEQAYVASRNDNALVVFNRDGVSGTLSFVEIHEDEDSGVFGLLGASRVAASPDGRHVYATAETDDTLVVFSRDATQDELTFIAAQVQEDLVGGVFGLDGASSVAVSPDDGQVFVTARVDDALAVFNRDATTDDLSFVEAELDGLAGVDGLDGAAAVAASPDDLHVYVASEIDDAIAVFVRGGAGGTISYASTVTDGIDGVDGLNGASGVAVSPDGLHVYAAGRAEDAVAAFSRDTGTGALTFLDVYRDGVDAEGLAGAFDLVLNAAGDRLAVSGSDDNAVAIFRRTPSTGELVFLEAIEDDVAGFDGLAGARGLDVFDDDMYVAGHDENALTVLDLALCLGTEASGDSDGDAVCDDEDVCLGDDFTGDDDDDGVCDDLDLCDGADATDSDSDGVCDDLDVCDGFDDALDADADGVPDGCDVCAGSDDAADADFDGVPDGCDVCAGFNDAPDNDSDGVPDGCDACLGFDDALDADFDNVPDGCDVCAGFDDAVDSDSDAVPDACDLCTGSDDAIDSDADTVPDGCDVCPGFDDTLDADLDGVPAGCDVCAGFDDALDADLDGVPDGCDACAGFDDAADADLDGVPDGCDVCTGDDADGDADGDGLCADVDCDDSDPTNACGIFTDGFESGDVAVWSSSVP